MSFLQSLIYFRDPLVKVHRMGFQRVAGNEKVMVILNYDNANAEVSVGSLVVGESWSPLAGTSSSGTVNNAGVMQISVPAQSFVVLKKN